MIKCLECGFEAERLQWTHFKYNCTGRFTNGTEYKKVYPDAKLVSPELAKTTAVTLENLIKKYGNELGTIKWNQYREKQAVTNSFEYKKEKYGWNKEDFDKYNTSRSQTLDKMISRYGESEGSAKWETYCLRQAYTNTKDYFVEKYGREIGILKYLEVNQKKSIPHNPTLLSEQLGITEDEAVQIILSRRSGFFFSNLEKEFIALIEQTIGKLDHTSLSNPFGKWSHLLDTYVVYDIKHKNCIIEFNGDYWHANPAIYSDFATIRGKTAIDIRKKDMLKLKTVEELGFRTLVVWENDFKQNKVNTIKKVTAWILQEQQ